MITYMEDEKAREITCLLDAEKTQFILIAQTDNGVWYSSKGNVDDFLGLMEMFAEQNRVMAKSIIAAFENGLIPRR